MGFVCLSVCMCIVVLFIVLFVLLFSKERERGHGVGWVRRWGRSGGSGVGRTVIRIHRYFPLKTTL